MANTNSSELRSAPKRRARKTKGSDTDRSVLHQIDELQSMSLKELQTKWRNLFGAEPPNLGRKHLIRRLAYRIQELVYGGLSSKAKRQLKELANTSDTKKSKAGNLQVGTRLIREWRGNEYEVIVQTDGFLLDGKNYRSLSAVARVITGTHRNGRRFFGLASAGKRGAP